MGNITNYSGVKLGIFEKNENICVEREIVIVPSASVGTVYAGRLGVNDTTSSGVTVVTKTRKTKGLYIVGYHEELLIII